MEVSKKPTFNTEFKDKTSLQMLMVYKFMRDSEIPIEFMNRYKEQSEKTWKRYADELSEINLLPPTMGIREKDGIRKLDGIDYVKDSIPATHYENAVWFCEPLIFEYDKLDTQKKELTRIANIIISQLDGYNMHCTLGFGKRIFREQSAEMYDEDYFTFLDTPWQEYKKYFGESMITYKKDLEIAMSVVAEITTESKYWADILKKYRNGELTIIKSYEESSK